MQREIEAGIRIQPYERYPGNGAYKICFTSTDLESVEQTKEKIWAADLHMLCIHMQTAVPALTVRLFQKELTRAEGLR